MTLTEQLPRVSTSFFPSRSLSDSKRLSGGLINQTFLITLDNGLQFVAQKINTEVFKDIMSVHFNIDLVADHLAKSDYRFVFPSPIVNAEGDSLFVDSNSTWRVLPFVRGSYSTGRVISTQMARNAGWALGHFHLNLLNFSNDRLKTTIPDFHSGRLRIAQYKEALKTSKSELPDLAKRIVNHFQVLEEWDAIVSQVPRRVVHFDTKIENFLFQNDTEEVAAIIDLDTLMTGSILSDVGDMIRSFCDEDLNFREPLLEGYLSEMGKHLSEAETTSLKFSGSALALMQCVRFLTDHLNGSQYYQTEYEGQNLDRAQQQFALYEDLHSSSC